MKRIAIGLLALLLLSTGHAEIYRWVDEQGVVHFGDEPPPGAERVDVGEPTVVDTPQQRSVPITRSGADKAARQAAAYERLSITSPGPQATVRNTVGRVEVRLALAPPLRRGDRIELSLDGEPVPASPLSGLTTTLEYVPRGTHTLRARVVGANGAERIAAEPVTFYLHRPSVNLPARN